MSSPHLEGYAEQIQHDSGSLEEGEQEYVSDVSFLVYKS